VKDDLWRFLRLAAEEEIHEGVACRSMTFDTSECICNIPPSEEQCSDEEE
jgi:hypothetical protein